jgi:hypothetical protein
MAGSMGIGSRPIDTRKPRSGGGAVAVIAADRCGASTDPDVDVDDRGGQRC